MKNRELFVRDPAVSELINNGQARITEGRTEQERRVLREELSHFVCEGKYADGIIRMLESFLGNLGSSQQPAAWVSGFYGSGKSHMLKMLHHLWVNTEFPEDGATARTLVPDLPGEIEDALKELDTQGRRFGGLHAASGTLPAGGMESVRLAVLGIILRSQGLPETYAQAKFCLYLKQNGFFDSVKAQVESKGKDFIRELNNLYVSPILHDALVEVDPGYGDRKAVRELLKKQFNQPGDITTAEFLATTKEVLLTGGQIPCTILLLDEVQQYIATDDGRATSVVEIAEALSKEMGCRVLLVGAGQSALGADTRQLTKLLARFTINIELQDQDVEAVTRKVLLSKKPDKLPELKAKLDSYAGEIERQLAGTRIGPRTEDRKLLGIDYPLLPTRRRFWEAVLRAVDPSGTSSMLRAQLRIIHDAIRDLADQPVGTVISGDYIFEQLQAGMVQQGVLLRELDETIRKLDDGTEQGKLARRVCGLVFLIRRLPRDGSVDLGIRATCEMLADLLVGDLKDGGAVIRRDLPPLLDKLVEEGVLLKDHEEYNLQTKEYSEWDKEFRAKKSRLQNNTGEIYHARDALIRDSAATAVKGVKLIQGESKIARKINIHFGDDPPEVNGAEIPVWVRDEWNCSAKSVLDAARAAGNDSPIVFVFVPKQDDEALRNQIIQYQGAKETLDLKGIPGTDEGKEARNAMQARMEDAVRRRDSLITEIVGRARVYKGGGTEQHELTVEEKIRSAAEDALDRLFPRFRDGDHKNWAVAISRAKTGSDSPLEAINWTAATEQHPVCKEVMRIVGSGAEGRAVRKELGESPYGWPQDAIDGALICLHATGHLTARYAGNALVAGQLDQAKAGKAEFRVETATLSAQDKIKLRGLFQEAGLSAKTSDDLTIKSSEFLDVLEKLSERAGGEPPLPERPKTVHLADLRSLAGNERLVKMLADLDALKANAKDWKAAAELADKRRPGWVLLKRMETHATALPEFDEIRTGSRGVEDNRLLLDGTDHVKPLVKKAAGVLRTVVSDAHTQLKNRHAEELAKLEANDCWQKINKGQREQILSEEAIADVPTIDVGSDESLLVTLDATPVSAWKDKTDALPNRFANAAMKAAKLLEPKTQRVHLSSGTLKTPDDVKAWLADQERVLLAKVNEGPVIIG
ncbi:MAG: BREX system P-loop protein BrxC [Phycisphaerae bacterium]|nr:BREX system P-loop protein BrxC [Phycisphaerae bacterium]